MSQPGLELRGLKHAYGRSPVLRGVDLDVRAGRVHALLGPNGAGKSTLISCLSGVLRPQAGSIRLGAFDLVGRSPAAVRHLGVSVIYQSLSLVDGLGVADNIFLGDELRRGPFVSRRRQALAAAALLEELGVPIDPGRPVGSLPVGEQQMVEIAKAAHGRVKFLVLDEPTAALGMSETDALLALVRRLTDAGVGVVYISHHLDEVMQIGDDVTVLRDGVVVDSGQVSGYTATRLLSAIAPSAPAATSASVGDVGAERLRVDSLEVDGVGPVGFSVGVGEVVALFGLLGSGRTEVLEAIAGARRRTGTVSLDGIAVAPGSVASCVRRGICLVPADRRHGVFGALSAQQNLLAPHHRSLARWGVRQIGRERQCFDTVAGQLALDPPEAEKPAWAFSGGNQQKLVVGRWLVTSRPQVLLLDEPTQGIDVGARRALHRTLRRLAAEDGVATVFSTSERAEALAVADRIVVLYRGRQAADLRAHAATEADLLAAVHRHRPAA